MSGFESKTCPAGASDSTVASAGTAEEQKSTELTLPEHKAPEPSAGAEDQLKAQLKELSAAVAKNQLIATDKSLEVANECLDQVKELMKTVPEEKREEYIAMCKTARSEARTQYAEELKNNPAAKPPWYQPVIGLGEAVVNTAIAVSAYTPLAVAEKAIAGATATAESLAKGNGIVDSVKSGVSGAYEKHLEQVDETGLAIDSVRKYTNEHLGGSSLGSDKEFANKSDLGLFATSVATAAQVALPGASVTTTAIMTGVGAIDAAYDSTVREKLVESFGEDSGIVTATDVALEGAKIGVAGYAVIKGQGVTGLKAQAAALGKTFGISAGMGSAGALANELYTSGEEGGSFNLGRFATNTLEGTSSSMLFMGGLSTLGRNMTVNQVNNAVKNGQSVEGAITQAVKKSSRLTEGADIVDALSGVGDTVDMFQGADNWQQIFASSLQAGVTAFDAKDFVLGGGSGKFQASDFSSSNHTQNETVEPTVQDKSDTQPHEASANQQTVPHQETTPLETTGQETTPQQATTPNAAEQPTVVQEAILQETTKQDLPTETATQQSATNITPLTQRETLEQTGSVNSTNNKVLYVDSAEKLTDAYIEMRSAELRNEGVEASEALAQAASDSKGVTAFFDSASNKIVSVIPDARLHRGADPTQTLRKASELVHEMTHHKAATQAAADGPITPQQIIDSEVAAYQAQAAYFRRNGFVMDFSQQSWRVLPLENSESAKSTSKLDATQGNIVPFPQAKATDSLDNILAFVRRNYTDTSKQIAAHRNGSIETESITADNENRQNSEATTTARTTEMSQSLDHKKQLELYNEQTEQLKNGEFPEALASQFQLVDPLSEAGKQFQQMMQERLSPVAKSFIDIEAQKVKFLLSDSTEANACVIINANPPIIIFNRGMFEPQEVLFYGDQILQEPLIHRPEELILVALHELRHARFSETHGTDREVGKLEESLCDLDALTAMVEADLNPTIAREFLQKLRILTQNSLESDNDGLLRTAAQIVDPHPTDAIRLSLADDKLAALRQLFGDIDSIPISKPFEANDPLLELVKNATHTAWGAPSTFTVTNGELKIPEHFDKAPLEEKINILVGAIKEGSPFSEADFNKLNEIVKSLPSNHKETQEIEARHQSLIDELETLQQEGEHASVIVNVEKEIQSLLEEKEKLQSLIQIRNPLLEAIIDPNSQLPALQRTELYAAVTNQQSLPHARLENINSAIEAFIVSNYGTKKAIQKAASQLLAAIKLEPLTNQSDGLKFLRTIQWDSFAHQKINPSRQEAKQLRKAVLDSSPWESLVKIAKTDPVVAEACLRIGLYFEPDVAEGLALDSNRYLRIVKEDASTFGSIANPEIFHHKTATTPTVTTIVDLEPARASRIFSTYCDVVANIAKDVENKKPGAAKKLDQMFSLLGEFIDINSKEAQLKTLVDSYPDAVIAINSYAFSKSDEAIEFGLETGLRKLQENNDPSFIRKLYGLEGVDWKTFNYGDTEILLQSILTSNESRLSEGNASTSAILNSNLYFNLLLNESAPFATPEQRRALIQNAAYRTIAITAQLGKFDIDETFELLVDGSRNFGGYEKAASEDIDAVCERISFYRNDLQSQLSNDADRSKLFTEKSGIDDLKFFLSILEAQQYLGWNKVSPAEVQKLVKTIGADHLANYFAICGKSDWDLVTDRLVKSIVTPTAERPTELSQEVELYAMLDKAGCLNDSNQYLLLDHIKPQIEAVEDIQLKSELSFQLLTAPNLNDFQLQQTLLNSLLTGLKSNYGTDDGSAVYTTTIAQLVQRIATETPILRQRTILASLAKGLELQPSSLDYIEQQLSVIETTLFNKSSKPLIGLEATLFAIQMNPSLSQPIADYLRKDRRYSQDAENYLVNTIAQDRHLVSMLTGKLSESGIQNQIEYPLEVRQIIARRHLQYLHDMFWSVPLESRAVIMKQIVLSVYEHEQGISAETVDRSLKTVTNGLKTNAKEVNAWIRGYVDSLPEYQRALAVVAGMSATKETGKQSIRLGEALRTFLGSMGPAETKTGQCASSHTLVAQEIRKDLEELKFNAAEPERWTVVHEVQRLSQDLLAGYNKHLDSNGIAKGDNLDNNGDVYIARIGKVIGSGSMAYTVNLELSDGTNQILCIRRPNILARAQAGFDTMAATVAKVQGQTSSTEIVEELIANGRGKVEIESNFMIADAQYELGQRLYNGVTVEIGDKSISFGAVDVTAVGEDFYLMSEAKGDHFLDLPGRNADADPQSKTAARDLALAVLTLELSNILHGSFDNDRHGGQLKVLSPESNNPHVEHFDFKATSLETWSDSGYRQLGQILSQLLIYDQQDTTDLATRLLQAQQAIRKSGVELDPLIPEVTKALLSLGDYIQLLDPQDQARAIFSALRHGMRPAMREVFTQELPKSLLERFNLDPNFEHFISETIAAVLDGKEIPEFVVELGIIPGLSNDNQEGLIKIIRPQQTVSETRPVENQATQRETLQQTGEVFSSNNNVLYLQSQEAVRERYAAQRANELITQRQLQQADAEALARDEAAKISSYYDITSRKIIAPFPAHRLTNDGARNSPGYEAAKKARILAGSMLVHELNHQDKLKGVDASTLDRDERLRIETDAYVAQAEYLWKNDIEMRFEEERWHPTPRTEKSLQVDRSAIEAFVAKQYPLTESQLFAANANQQYAVDARKTLEQRKKLFSGIKNLPTIEATASPDVIRNTQIALVGKIFEHSVSDGIEIAKAVHLTPKEVTEAISGRMFAQKHELVLDQLLGKLGLLINEYPQLNEIISLLKTQSIYQNNRHYLPTASVEKLLGEMDDHYAQFLRTKTFAPMAEPPSTLTKGESLALRNLETAKDALNGVFYSDGAKRILHAELLKNGTAEAEAQTLIQAMLPYDELARVSTETLKRFCAKNNLEWDAVIKKLEKARYTNALYPLERKLTQREISKELNQSLANRGGRVVLNPKNDSYEVVFDLDPPKNTRLTEVNNYPLELGKEEKVVNTYETVDGPVLQIGFENSTVRFLKDKDLQDLSHESALADLIERDGKVFQRTADGLLLDHTQKVLSKEPFALSGTLAVIDGVTYLKKYQIKERRELLQDENLQLYGNSQGYDHIFDVASYKGNLALSVTTNDGYAIIDGKSGDTIAEYIIGSWPDSDYTHPMVPIDIGDVTYTPITNASGLISGVLINGQYQQLPYERVSEYFHCGDKLYFHVKDQGAYFLVDNEGREIGKQLQLKEAISKNPPPQVIDGKLHFLVQGRIYNEDGQRLFANYPKIAKFSVIDGKIYAAVPKNQQNGWQIVCSDGRIFGNDRLISTLNHIALGDKKFSYLDSSNNQVALVNIDPVEIELPPLPQRLGKREAKKLDLLNLVHAPTRENFENRYATSYGQLLDTIPGLAKGLRYSAQVVDTLNRAIREAPEAFLNSISLSAKRDGSPAQLAQQLTNLLVPELQRRNQPSFLSLAIGFLLSGKNQDKTNPWEYLRERSTTALMGGGTFNDKQAVIQFRNKEDSTIVTQLFGRYNKENNKWEKHEFPIARKLNETALQTTYTLSNVGVLPAALLPKSLDAEVILDRVHGIDKKGNEVALQTEINSLGEVSALIPSGSEIQKIVYSVRKNQVPEIINELEQQSYDNFRAKFDKDYGTEMSQSIARLPEETQFFLDEIKTLPPKEQVIAIEEYSRALTFYDFDNNQVNKEKVEQPIEDQLAIMQRRVGDIAAKKPKLAEALSNKQFAGVCADSAILTTAMLRHAGFVSGTTECFLPEGKKAKVSDAHATSFVVWPDSDGALRVFIVDGTPESSDPKFKSPALPSIQQREADAKELQKSLDEVKAIEVQQLIDAIERTDVSTIRLLENGKLESLVNTMLTSMVKEQQLELLNGLLNFYWYTPLQTLDLNNPRNSSYFNDNITAELDRIRTRLTPSDTPAGDALFTTISDFVDHFASTGIITDRSAALRTLEQIFEAAKPSLTPTEAKAAFAIVNYLRAKRMVSEA